MQFTLIDTGVTGRVAINGKPARYRDYEVSERKVVELHGRLVRPHSVTVYSNGDVHVFFVFVTKQGRDFKRGDGYPESLRGMSNLPDVREAIARAVEEIAGQSGGRDSGNGQQSNS